MKDGRDMGKERRRGAGRPAAPAVGVLAALGIALFVWALLSRAPRLRVRTDAPDDVDRYTLSVVMHAGEGTCAVTERIVFRNRTGEERDHAVLRFYPNALRTGETSPLFQEDPYDGAGTPGFSPGCVTLQGIRVGGAAAENEWLDGDMTALKVSVGSLAPGGECVIDVNYVLTVPECAFRFGRTGDTWLLCDAFAVLAVWDEEAGAFRTDPWTAVGSPAVSDTALWEITAVPDEGWSAAASFPLTAGEGGAVKGRAVMREAALVFLRGRVPAEGTFGDVRIRALTGKDGDRIVSRAAGMMRVFLETYGDCPWETLTVVSAPLCTDEVTRPGLIVLSEDLFGGDEEWETVLARGAAKQWFCGLVGVDGFTDPWQGEAPCVRAVIAWAGRTYGSGAAEQLALAYTGMPMRETVYESVTPGSPLDRFGGEDVYDTVARGRGGAYIQALDICLGGGVDAFLRTYVERFAWERASRADFESLLEEVSGKDLRELTADYLDTLMN